MFIIFQTSAYISRIGSNVTLINITVKYIAYSTTPLLFYTQPNIKV